MSSQCTSAFPDVRQSIPDVVPSENFWTLLMLLDQTDTTDALCMLRYGKAL